MKILFCADLQLEAGQHFGVGEYGPDSRFADQEAMLSQIVNIVAAERVDLVCVLGDVFDRAKPSPWSVLAFQSFLRHVRAAHAEILVIPGNHDVKSASIPTILRAFSDGVSFYEKPGALLRKDCSIITLPWAPLTRVVARDLVPRDQINHFVSASLVDDMNRIYEGVAELIRDGNASPRVIIVGHWAISGAALPNGVTTDAMPEPVIPLPSILAIPCSLAVFGHVHKMQCLTRPPDQGVYYCGSPMVMDWGEAEQPHGVMIYECDGADCVTRFVPLGDRTFMTIGDCTDGYDVSDAIVRVRWDMDEDEARSFDSAAMRQDLLDRGARKVFLQPTIVKKERVRTAEMSDTMTSAAAVETWVRAEGADDDDVARLLAMHEEYEGRLD